MKPHWCSIHNFTLVLTLSLIGSVWSKSCSHKGFIVGGKASREFYVCTNDTIGELVMKKFMCGEGSIFSAEKKLCVLGNQVVGSSNDNIRPSPNFDIFQATPTNKSTTKDDTNKNYFEKQHQLSLTKNAPIEGREMFYEFKNGDTIPSTTVRIPMRNIQPEERDSFYGFNSRAYISYTTTPSPQRTTPKEALWSAGFGLSTQHNRGVNPLLSIREGQRDKECPIAKGRFCHTCTTLVSCVNYRVVSVQQCITCNPYLQTCSNEFIPECVHENHFICTSFGLFPDPYFCNRYYFCRGPDTLSYYFHCDPGMVFDPYLEECQPDLSGQYHYYSPCPSLPKCQEDFQVGTMYANKQFYYVCIEDEHGILRRIMYKCPKNNIYNGQECVRHI